MKQDRFLMVILGVIGALVVAALILFFVRQASQTYGAENTPDGVVHNYVLALQKNDLQRAFGYLADNQGKPTFLQFQQSLTNGQLDTSSVSVQIGYVTTLADGSASVELTLLHSNGGAFGSTYTDTQTATLLKVGGSWKISVMPNPFWGYDWYNGQVAPPGKTVPAQPAPVQLAPTTTP